MYQKKLAQLSNLISKNVKGVNDKDAHTDRMIKRAKNSINSTIDPFYVK